MKHQAMPDELEISAPRLAHPLGAAAQSEPAWLVPAFPDVGARWEGFCLPTMRCMGWRRDLIAQIRSPEDFSSVPRMRSLVLATLHEHAHWMLSACALPAIVRAGVLIMWKEISFVAAGERLWQEIGTSPVLIHTGPTRVPVTPNPSGTHLEKLWAKIVEWARTMELVHEVYAVWYSLHEAQCAGVITPRRRAALTKREKEKYSKGISYFSLVYDEFENVAEQIDATAAHALAAVALTTDPRVFVRAIVFAKAALRAGHPPTREMLRGWMFIRLAEPLKDTTSRIGRVRDLLRLDYSEDYPDQTWARLPDEPLPCVFDHRGISFELPLVWRVFIANLRPKTQHPENAGIAPREGRLSRSELFEYVWRDSIRQQMTRGVGLVCPFWTNSQAACGRCPRMEGLWRHTEGSPEKWRQPPCLQGIASPRGH